MGFARLMDQNAAIDQARREHEAVAINRFNALRDATRKQLGAKISDPAILDQ